MNEPLWLKRIWLDAIHFQQLQRFGGLYGTRDTNAIDAALARPQHRWAYEPGIDLADLAAAYGYGLIRNHGYTDGNKRIGFVALAVFPDLNGWELIAPEAEVVTTIVAVAAGTLSEAELAAWIRSRMRRLEEPLDSQVA